MQEKGDIMQILEKAEKFYLDNEEIIWKGIFAGCVIGYFAYLGYVFGGAKYYGKGFGEGVKMTESLVAAMEPEAYARICKNAEVATKILK